MHIFRKILILLILLTAASCNLTKDANKNKNYNLMKYAFIKGTDDIPLAKNLELIDDEQIEFDSIAGSFSSSKYQSSNSIETIKDFYLKTLPSLGWKPIKNEKNSVIFMRDNQKLEIEFITKFEKTLIIFALTIMPQ